MGRGGAMSTMRAMNLRPSSHAPLLLGLSLILAACAGDDSGDGTASSSSSSTGAGMERAVEVRFEAAVGDEAFACGTTYPGLGTTAADAKVTDLRFYLHDVALVGGGERYPLTLDASEWQNDGVVLLDFEDGSGGCEGTPERNMSIKGAIPAGANVDALEFTIGIPEAMNHLDNATAESPLNLSAMFWSWTNGYKFLKVDLDADGLPFYFHLGSSMCSGMSPGPFACMYGHRVTLRVEGFDPDADTILFDLAELFAGADLTTPNDMMVDPVDGCMSGPMDPECPAVFAALGLQVASSDTNPASQVVFRKKGG